MKKLRVGILFGGKSAEHEVSLRSAKNVIAALDRERYEPVEILIGKDGNLDPLLAYKGKLDAVFLVIHGTNGEDGTMQGLLKLLDVPFVGPGVLGSAVGMDKDVAKRLLRDAGIPIARFVTVQARDRAKISFDSLAKELGAPMFVKPANAGSSVGVHKIKTASDFDAAVDDAFKYDTKILFEEFVKGREIEVAVLGNEEVAASVAGEIIPHHEFYSYEAKYLDENGAGLEIPAKLDEKLSEKIRAMAIATFKALACEGMARVDFFVRGEEVFINEINTIPGFTSISMYPKLWEASGVSYKDLISKLIELAIARHEREKKLSTSFLQ